MNNTGTKWLPDAGRTGIEQLRKAIDEASACDIVKAGSFFYMLYSKGRSVKRHRTVFCNVRWI